MREDLKVPAILSAALVGLMATQSLLGLAASQLYRDPQQWVRATFFGNDLVTLVVAVPLLVAALLLAGRGSVRGLLLWVGVLGFAIYNYAYYLVAAAINAFFPLYVVLAVLSVVTLVLVLTRIDAEAVASCFRPGTPVRLIGGYLAFVGVGLGIAWIAQWAGVVFGGVVPDIGVEPFHIVATMDLTLMVPVMVVGGVMLWRRQPWGFVIAAIAGIEAGLYTLVLTAGSAVNVWRGLAQAPGEVPVWAALTLATGVATAALLWGAGPSEPR